MTLVNGFGTYLGAMLSGWVIDFVHTTDGVIDWQSFLVDLYGLHCGYHPHFIWLLSGSAEENKSCRSTLIISPFFICCTHRLSFG